MLCSPSKPLRLLLAMLMLIIALPLAACDRQPFLDAPVPLSPSSPGASPSPGTGGTPPDGQLELEKTLRERYSPQGIELLRLEPGDEEKAVILHVRGLKAPELERGILSECI